VTGVEVTIGNCFPDVWEILPDEKKSRALNDEKKFKGSKNCDLDLLVEWFQLLFRKIKLTTMKAMVCPKGTSEIY